MWLRRLLGVSPPELTRYAREFGLKTGARIFTAIENLLAASSSLGSGLSFGVLNVPKNDRDEKLCSFWVKLTFFVGVVEEDVFKNLRAKFDGD